MSASTPASSMEASHKSLKRSISNTFKGSAGNLVEWYDVYVYSVFASYFETKFFSGGDKNATLYVWAIFAVTFLMRPIGAWFFGRFADRHGRRAALTVSVTLMAVCSFAIAIVPTSVQIGVGAAVILIIARLLQGFATGGEYGASATYMSEAAVPGRRGLLSSFHYVTLVGGHVLAQLLLFLLLTYFSKEQVSDWGWRVGFAIGGLAAIVVFWLRRSMDESLESSAIAEAKTGGARSGSLRELFVNQWRPLLLCFLITAGGTLAFYTYSVTGPKIIQTAFAGGDVMKGTVLNLIALSVLMLLQPVGGWLSDIVGRKSLLVFFGLGSVVYTWYMLTALPQQTAWAPAFVILVVSFIILTGYTSINAVVKAELFPPHIRALGVGLGYALANSLFGGTAPMLYQWAQKERHMETFITYATVVMFVSLLVYLFCLKNKGENWLDNAASLDKKTP